MGDYAEILKQTNPGSSVWIIIDTESQPGKNLFNYFYVCLDTLKREWLGRCRRIIGLDGSFLRGHVTENYCLLLVKMETNRCFQ